MKKLVLLVSLLLAKNCMVASVHIIGNDTIYFDEGIYFKIYLADTFYVDTSVFIVQFDSEADTNDILDLEQLYDLNRRFEFSVGFISYSYDTNQCFLSLYESLENEPIISEIEVSTSVKFLCDPLVPNDDHFEGQQYLYVTQIASAWNLSTGDPDVIVEIIDSGFDWEHDDFGPGSDGYDNIYFIKEEDDWTYWNVPSSGEGDDDNGNGHKDDWKGWGEGEGINGMNNDVRPFDKGVVGETNWLHGIFIAGIIGAKTNNDNFISGIAGGWNCKGASILQFKAGVLENSYTYEILAHGFEYAVDEGADIIELAWTSPPNSLITTEINHAYNSGIFIVAAAGNHEQPPSTIVFPAYLENTFAVGATDYYDYVKENSNWGPELELCAPGDNMDVIVPDPNEYPDYGIKTIFEGNTSAASAIVSGTAALMLSIKPDLSNVDIANILRSTADKVHPEVYNYNPESGWADEIGYGRLNALSAVCEAMNYGEDLEITEDKVWCGHKAFLKSVYVKSGAILTITGEVSFGPDAKLVIEPGGKVVVDGGILTNLKCCL